MDLLNKLANQGNNDGYYSKQPAQQQDSQSGSGGLLDKLQSMANGSPKREEKPSGSSSLVDKLQSLAGGSPKKEEKPSGSSSLVDKLHGMVGGGPESEKQEDLLDKGIDWVQEHILGQGPQDNESAIEQAKDRMIANAIRDQYKKATGREFPIKKKEEEKPNGLVGLFSSR